MKQYIRLYYDAGGNIKHVHTQTTPIDFEPVPDDPDIVSTEDIELEDESAEPFIRAREFLNNMEVRGGRAEFKPSAPSTMRNRNITRGPQR